MESNGNDNDNDSQKIIEQTVENKNKNDNETENESTKTYSLVEIEDFLKNNKVPPGIKEYDDMPEIGTVEITKSTIEKIKKPWENDDNIKNLKLFEN